MAFQVTCPGCGTVYRLPTNPQGPTIKLGCKKCKTVFSANLGKSSAKSPERPTSAPARRSSSPFLLIVVGLLLFMGIGATGVAVAGYFAYSHFFKAPNAFAQVEQPAPFGDGPKIEPELDPTPPKVNPLLPKVDPTPPKIDPVPPKIDPTPPMVDPIPPKVDPTPPKVDQIPPKVDPTTPKVDPVPPKVDPTPPKVDPVPPKVDPTPPKVDPIPPKVDPIPPKVDPVPPKVEPMPPAIASLYQLKDPPTPPVEIKLAESANHIVLTPDGKTAIISQRGLGAERRVTFMELPSGKVLKSIPMPELSVNSVILTPTAKSVLLGGDDDRFNVAPLDRVYIRTIALDSGKIIGAIRGPARGVDHLAISPDGTTLACAESNFTGPRGVIRVINLKNGANLFYKEGVHTNTTHGLGLTPDKKYVVSTGTDSNTGVCKVVVSDIAARKEKHVFKGFPGIAEGMAVSSDGKLVAAAINGGNGGSVRVWDIETGAEVLALLATAGNRGASRVAFGPDNKSIIATFYDASTRAFDLLTGNEEGGFRGHGIIPNVMVAAPNGKTVVTAYFRDMKVWQFPDSLRRLGKPDDPPAFAIVRDGKKIDVRPPTSAVKDDKLFKIFVNAVVDAIVDDKSSLAVTVDGTPEKLWLHPAAKFFDADGKPVLAADAGRIYRLGNIVTIKTKKEFKTPIAEVRLVREGPKEISVANARLKATRYPGGIFLATPTRELNVSFGPEVRYVDHEGKETTKETGKFFNEEDQYAVKLRLEVGQDFPLLIEARLTPDKGELPVFLKYPLGMIGAKAIKNATIKRVTEGNVSYLVLDIPGANHVSLFTGNESKGYDVKGDELTRQQLGLLEGLRSDVVIVARGKSNLLLEARALVPFPKAEPPPRKFAELKNVEVARLKNSQQSFLKINGKNVLLRLDANVKALDKEGKDIAADRVLQNGNRVDAKVEEVGPNRILHEVRLVEGTTIPERAKTYENAQVTKIGSNKIYTLKAGDTGILAGVSKATRCLDAAGNPADLDQVLRVGNHVDIIVQTGPSAIGNLIEVRAAKKK